MNFKKENLSPSEIVKDLQNAVLSLPDSVSWSDYFAGGTGRTIIELIAGSQAIKNHYNLMRVRESSLQVAKLDSSVTELAINKGVYRPPAKSYIIEVSFTSSASGSIQKGELLGRYKNYNVYSLENLNYNFGPNNKILVTIGDGEKFQTNVITSTEFQTIDIVAKNRNVGEEFQTLTVNGEVVDLIDVELNLYDSRLPNSCLRLVYDNSIRLIFGDGVIGKKLKANDVIEYSYMSFGNDLIQNFSVSKLDFPLLTDVTSIQNITVIRNPSTYIDKEILRKIAIRNSVDGRWVQIEDYKNGILREYGNYLDDVLVKDVYPSEEIIILPKKDVFTEGVKTLIRNIVDNKRGNATLVNITYLDPYDNNRLDLTFNLLYSGPETTSEVNLLIDSFVNSKLNKIFYEGYWITGSDIAVELTSISKGKFYADLKEEFFIEPLQSVKTLQINIAR